MIPYISADSYCTAESASFLTLQESRKTRPGAPYAVPKYITQNLWLHIFPSKNDLWPTTLCGLMDHTMTYRFMQKNRFC